MSTLKQLTIAPPILLGFGLVWLAAMAPSEPPQTEPTERRIPVSYVTATPRTFAPSISGYGTVEPARVWTANTEVAGTIDYLHPAFERGGFVAAGDVLASITPEDYELALAIAEAEVRTAEARVEELKVTERTTKASLEIERASLNFAENDLARTMQLAKTGVVSEAIVETKRRDVLTQRSKVQSLDNTLALLPSQIDAAEQSAAAAWFARMSAELDVARTVVKVPFDARVARMDVELNQFVGVGNTIGVLDGVEAVEVDVQVSQQRMAELVQLTAAEASDETAADDDEIGSGVWADVQQVSAKFVGEVGNGEEARFTAWISPADIDSGISWPAELARISGEVNPDTRSMGIILRVVKPDGQNAEQHRPPLIKGMFVRADITAPSVKNVILLPRSTIRNGRVMLIGADDRLGYQSIHPIFTDDDMVVLAPGALPEGVRVVTSDPSPAIEGVLLAPKLDHMVETKLQALSVGDPQ